MNNKGRVIVAMSGGVDSSVAAAILKQEGYQVIGATMQVWPSDRSDPEVERFGGCCGIGVVEDAKRVAHKLDIPHYVLNFRDIFAQKVITDFCHEYLQGRTPNPCIRCNQYIKFDALLARATELGADFIATGHHARITRDTTSGRYYLKKGGDRNKDQSYFLYTLTQEQLSHTLMPIGNLTKGKVREIAREFDLAVAEKPESQEICFIPENNYSAFLKEQLPEVMTPGPILNQQGKVLGEHPGIAHFTVGQRRRLGISAGEPLYVTAIDHERNAVMIGSKREAHNLEFTAVDLNWIAVAGLAGFFTAKARIRYRHEEAEATVMPLNEEVRVRFREPQLAITPGQAVVFYEGETVIGGGTIEKVWRESCG